jgi:hypothetical protein
MDNEIQLISDDDGLMVIGNAMDVDRFLISEGLSSSKDLGPQWLKSVFGAGAAVAQAGSEFAADSGRWVKLTPKSAQLVKKYGLRESSKTGFSTGVVKGQKGQIRGFVEFVKGPRSFLTNPAALANAAKLMSQVAMQQSMDEITDYLATIDAKVEDVLRAQKDTVLSRMIGVGIVIDETMTIRETRGRARRRRSRRPRCTPCVNSTRSRKRWSGSPRSVISPRRSGKRSPRFGSGSPFWLAVSNCRTRSPCSNSTGCWTSPRRSWTVIASD